MLNATMDNSSKADWKAADAAGILLHVMIDISSSMNEYAPGIGKKIDHVKKKLSEFLKGKSFKSTSLWLFDTELHHLGALSDAHGLEEAFSEYLRYNRLTGGTKIWDCISDLLDSKELYGNVIIVCITDGADLNSRNSLDSVKGKVRARRQTELVILDIAGQLRKSVENEDNDGQAIVEYIEDPDSLDIHLEKVLNKVAAPKAVPVEMKVSYPVIPLVECSAETLEQVRSSMSHIVPYLQALTGLRCYPVTTCIVDRHLISDISLERRRKPGPNACDLKKEIEEINQFIYGIVLTYHCREYCCPDGRWLQDLDHFYEGLSPLSPETSKKILWYCEYLPQKLIKDILDGTIQEFNGRTDIFLPEISSRPHIVENCCDFLMTVLEILKNVKARYGGQLTMGRAGLRNGNSVRYQPDLEAWKKLMSRKDFNTVLSAVNEEGYWINDMDHMMPVFEAAINTIFPLLGRMGNISLAPIVSSLRTYGIYSPSGSARKALKAHLDKVGFPSWFSPAEGAAVLLCVEEIEERLKEAAGKSDPEDGTESKPDFDEKALRGKLIFETLLHEHTHAIIDEGRENDEPGACRVDIYNSKKASLINESLAEWSALNYFRNDEEMFEIISSHAMQGDLPDWPYAGATRVEQKFGKAGLSAVRSLLNLLRSNPEEAYRYFKTT